jgi:orotidine-5'-phosphate decarboxylase
VAIDTLHDKIRKLKNPSVIDFGIKDSCLPPHLLEEEGSYCGAYTRFCRELMNHLKGAVPAVRFPFGAFALLGGDGLQALKALLEEASQLGFYVILDAPEILSPWAADRAAELIFGKEAFPCDGLVISPYIGSDAIKPFVPYCKDQGKDLFVILRSPNKSAAELQDLRSGSRLAHTAAADIASRYGEPIFGKSGYSRICGVASAGAPESLRTLREKYKRMYLLVDGLDYPSGNAKNCSYAFDRFGYGAAVCAGPSVTTAWMEAESDGKDYLEHAAQAADRMKRNITRYITIL